ncbi:hypothetical protein [Bradyrhizobium sp. AUGA SZCCT0431]|uniref:hypothetical protein n=1 Tax=Bradyrhizobium sp. AUGA SZCCT0431 TaxID=2807674 RepID=UPI001BA82AE6|nr:hypothetical protein [Bradyrhizobium sp. AUGA SZCCT0431]MBR1148014.1 hypothetical protein [Bradyrhizobium sp. AUGA SZCCT0431]
MADVTLGTLFILFLPFLLSLFGQGGMAKMLTLVTSILALLLSVKEYGAVLPWITGMAIALISVWERIRRRRMA